jgi:hypothetical protein
MKDKRTKGRSQVVADIARLLDQSRPMFDAARKTDELHKLSTKASPVSEWLAPPEAAKTEAPPQPASAKPAASKRRRKPGGGAKSKLTGAEAAELRAIYRRDLAKYPRLRWPRFAIPHMWKTPLWKSLLKAKRGMSETILRRHVLGPVRREQNKPAIRTK